MVVSVLVVALVELGVVEDELSAPEVLVVDESALVLVLGVWLLALVLAGSLAATVAEVSVELVAPVLLVAVDDVSVLAGGVVVDDALRLVSAA